MFRGEAVETGTTDAIFNRGQHPYTRALLSAVPKLDRWVVATIRCVSRYRHQERRDAVAESEAAGVDKGSRPLLEVKNLTTRFDIRSGLLGRRSGAVHAVENVSLLISGPARRCRWSANPVVASRRPGVRSRGWWSRLRGRSRLMVMMSGG